MSEAVPDPDQAKLRKSHKAMKIKASVQLEEGLLHSGKGASDRLENIKMIAQWIQNGSTEAEIIDSQIYSHTEYKLKEYIKLARRWLQRVNHPLESQAKSVTERRENP